MLGNSRSIWHLNVVATLTSLVRTPFNTFSMSVIGPNNVSFDSKNILGVILIETRGMLPIDISIITITELKVLG
jgi:hypothetical protein